MDIDLKLHNEAKIEVGYINNASEQTRIVTEFIRQLFKNKIDFNLTKDWGLSVLIKNDEGGITSFKAVIKMTDKYISGNQLEMFHQVEALEFAGEK